MILIEDLLHEVSQQETSTRKQNVFKVAIWKILKIILKKSSKQWLALQVTFLSKYGNTKISRSFLKSAGKGNSSSYETTLENFSTLP